MTIDKYVCDRPHVGIGVIIKKDEYILMGHRIGAHGSNTWSFPGGKLDAGESLFDCAKREVLEETDLYIKNLILGPYTNDIFDKEKLHYVTLYVLADYESGVPKITEPDKCLEWRWVDWNNMPQPVFLPIKNLLNQVFNPFKK